MATAIHETTTLADLKAGFTSHETAYECLFCGHRTLKGHVYRRGDDLVEAALAMRDHLAADHGSVPRCCTSSASCSKRSPSAV